MVSLSDFSEGAEIWSGGVSIRNDPQAAIKIMWNYEYRPFFIDDFREGCFG